MAIRVVKPRTDTLSQRLLDELRRTPWQTASELRKALDEEVSTVTGVLAHLLVHGRIVKSTHRTGPMGGAVYATANTPIPEAVKA